MSYSPRPFLEEAERSTSTRDAVESLLGGSSAGFNDHELSQRCREVVKKYRDQPVWKEYVHSTRILLNAGLDVSVPSGLIRIATYANLDEAKIAINTLLKNPIDCFNFTEALQCAKFFAGFEPYAGWGWNLFGEDLPQYSDMSLVEKTAILSAGFEASTVTSFPGNLYSEIDAKLAQECMESLQRIGDLASAELCRVTNLIIGDKRLNIETEEWRFNDLLSEVEKAEIKKLLDRCEENRKMNIGDYIDIYILSRLDKVNRKRLDWLYLPRVYE